MRIGVGYGYCLGHHPVRFGAGECEAPGCTQDATRALLLLLPPGSEVIQPRTGLSILWLCVSCAEKGRRILEHRRQPSPDLNEKRPGPP